MGPWWMALAQAAELPEARIEESAPATPRELDADARLSDRACPRELADLPIGLGRLCARRPAEGVALLGLLGADTAVAAAGFEAPYGKLGMIGVQNVVFASASLDALDGWLRHERPYTAPETLGELVAAPFRPVVLKRPGVWITTTLWTGAAVTTVVLVEQAYGSPDPGGGSPNLFGWSAPPALGYPLGTAALGATYLHVAVGEELLFRGVVQSALSRALGPTPGLIVASLVFTGMHVTNWLFVDEELQTVALILGPTFVGTGALVTGGLYQGYGYRLSHSIAAHFWYDFALSMTSFVLYPETSTLSARISLPF